MKLICKCLGGSHMYGLNTPESDVDYRGIFLNDNISTIIGLDRYEHQDLRNDTQDEFYWEFRHYINSLRKTNTQSLELLFNEDWISIEPLFKQVQKLKEHLIDSEKLHSSLTGYMHNEFRLATGERTGDMGSKRRNQLEKYSFSPKNFTNLFRLAYCGAIFFEEGYFPTNIKEDNPLFAERLLRLKLRPEDENKEELTKEYSDYKDVLDDKFNNRKYDYKFNADIANDLILEAYFGTLLNHYYKEDEIKGCGI